jgi:hypothetical protein
MENDQQLIGARHHQRVHWRSVQREVFQMGINILNKVYNVSVVNKFSVVNVSLVNK